jgi:cysteine synthase A
MTPSSNQPAAIPSALTDIGPLIGNTPLIEIRLKFRGKVRSLFAKAEHLNLTGSIKDRMAAYVLERAYVDGQIHQGDTIAEATSGNSGISFAAIGRALGHTVHIYMPRWVTQARIDLLNSLGALVHLINPEEGGYSACIGHCEELARTQSDVFLPRQFSNPANIEDHALTTGPEIQRQLASIGLKPDAFVAGVGTGGTVMGVGQYLRSANPKVQIHPLEPTESKILSTGCALARHRIQGISGDIIPEIIDLSSLDRVITVDDGDSILMAQALASQLGLAVGISSGANLIGALIAQEDIGPEAVVATVFPDDNKKYLSTDLTRKEPVKAGFYTPEIELLGYRAIKRASDTCTVPA